jgi:hypothetical protein
VKQKILDFLKENPDCNIALLYDELPTDASWLVGTEKTAIQARTEDIRESMIANGDRVQTYLGKILDQMIAANEIVEIAPNRFSVAE